MEAILYNEEVEQGLDEIMDVEQELDELMDAESVESVNNDTEARIISLEEQLKTERNTIFQQLKITDEKILAFRKSKLLKRLSKKQIINYMLKKFLERYDTIQDEIREYDEMTAAVGPLSPISDTGDEVDEELDSDPVDEPELDEHDEENGEDEEKDEV